MLPRKLTDIQLEHIRALVENGVAESRIIEFKRELPTMNDSGKKELLADVSAFANSIGGDLVFGIDEVDGFASECLGLAGFDPDADLLTLQSLIRDSVSPRLPVECECVPGFDRGPVLVIRVAHSWAAPHMVTYKNSSRFFARSNGGRYQMDVTDLRNAFGLMGEAKMRIENWIRHRVSLVQDGDSLLGQRDGLLIAVHVIPMESFDESVRLQPDDFPEEGEARRRLQPPTGNGWNSQFNFDGLALVSPGGVPSYTQLFRTGKIEKVVVQPADEREWELNGHSLDKKVIECAWDGIQALLGLGLSMPMLVSVSICNAENARIYWTSRAGPESERAIGIRKVIAPEILLEEVPRSFPKLIKPALDVIWNASGLRSSKSFRDGQFVPRLPEDIPNEA